ncbi:MAG: polysaccharide deacetylase family protein [Lacunisphaera sp.]
MNLRLLCALAILPVFAFAAATGPKTVALVFDDGPAPQQTQRLLELLHKEGVTVTFSYLGREVEKHPELARAAASAGHEINNHSYTHPHLRTLDDAAVSAEISRTSAAIERATGHPPVWFWSPFLETDERIDRLVKAATGLTHFPWLSYHFISTDDWDEAHTAPATIRHNATTGVTDGTIILFHEWREATLEQLPEILTELRRQGCVFVTLSGLQTRFGDKAPAAKK